jgi:hypothetical protein
MNGPRLKAGVTVEWLIDAIRVSTLPVGPVMTIGEEEPTAPPLIWAGVTAKEAAPSHRLSYRLLPVGTFWRGFSVTVGMRAGDSARVPRLSRSERAMSNSRYSRRWLS